MPTEIAVPFRIDGNGRVVTTSDPDLQVRQHFLALVYTTPEERAMVPGYGIDGGLSSLTFEDTDEVEAQVSLRVKDALLRHEPGIELVKTIPDPSDDMGVARVSLEYRRLDAPDSATLANANIAVVGANGVVREVVRG